MANRFRAFLSLLALAPAALLAQNNPLISGDNPSVQLGSTRFNMGTMRIVAGSGQPATVSAPNGTNLALGDYYLDSGSGISYQCFAASGPCTAVATGNWVSSAFPTVVSVTAWGVNGTSSDPANLQTAIAAMAYKSCLYIPPNTTVDLLGGAHVSLVSGTCIKGGNQTNSLVAGSGTASGVGMLDIPASAQDITLEGFRVDGGITSPTGVNYSSVTGGAAISLLTTGSSIWAHGPNKNVTIRDVTINHTGGYSAFFDASTGAVSGVQIQRVTVQNARPNLFGTSSLIYGSWTGGILFYASSTVSGNGFTNVVVDSSIFQNVTGNALWFSRSPGSTYTTNSSVVRFTNNTFIDVGLDAIQVNGIDGYIETGNRVQRFGYVVTSDVGASRVGGPLWLQGYTPVAFDTYANLTSFVRANNWAEGNGEMYDLDGAAEGSVIGSTFESCFFTNDPLAVGSSCGPSVAVGSNYTRGILIGNSSGLGAYPFAVNVSGNNFLGVGNSGVVLFPCNNCSVTGNNIEQIATFANPIVLGNVGTSQPQHSYNNLVTGNQISYFTASSGAVIFEDGVSACTCPMFSTDVNTVFKNNILVNSGVFEFQHSTPDASGSGVLTLNSVTPGNTLTVNGIVLAVQGTGNPYLSYYLNNGSGTLLGTVTPSGNQDQVVNFAGLPAVVGAGYRVYCTNCTAGSSPCTGGGTGHTATTNGSIWTCN